MKKLYRFSLSWGRMGSLQGIFVVDDQDVKRVRGMTVNLGEALGKHSNVEFCFGDGSTTLVELTDDQDFIEKFEEFDCASGRNPFNNIPCPDCGGNIVSPYTDCTCGWKRQMPEDEPSAVAEPAEEA